MQTISRHEMSSITIKDSSAYWLVPLLRRVGIAGDNLANSGTLRDIRGTISAVWDSLCDQRKTIESRTDSRTAMMALSEAFAKQEREDLLGAWRQARDGCIDLLSVDKPMQSTDIPLKLPAGKHLVVPMMVNGFANASIVNRQLMEEGRSLGVAFVGFSSRNLNSVMINEVDHEVLLRNQWSSMLLVYDGILPERLTVPRLKNALQEIGITKMELFTIMRL